MLSSVFSYCFFWLFTIIDSASFDMLNCSRWLVLECKRLFYVAG